MIIKSVSKNPKIFANIHIVEFPSQTFITNFEISVKNSSQDVIWIAFNVKWYAKNSTTVVTLKKIRMVCSFVAHKANDYGHENLTFVATH